MVADDVALALIAPGGPDSDFYRSQLVRHGAQVSVFSSVAAFRDGCAGLRLSGLAADLACMASLPEDEKAFLGGLVDSFPFARLRRVGPPHEIAGTYGGEAFSAMSMARISSPTSGTMAQVASSSFSSSRYSAP